MGELTGLSAGTIQTVGIITSIVLVSVLKDWVKSKFFQHNPNFQTLDDKLDEIIVLLSRLDERLKK
jgi:hypothetical protein